MVTGWLTCHVLPFIFASSEFIYSAKALGPLNWTNFERLLRKNYLTHYERYITKEAVSCLIFNAQIKIIINRIWKFLIKNGRTWGLITFCSLKIQRFSEHFYLNTHSFRPWVLQKNFGSKSIFSFSHKYTISSANDFSSV